MISALSIFSAEVDLREFIVYQRNCFFYDYCVKTKYLYLGTYNIYSSNMFTRQTYK